MFVITKLKRKNCFLLTNKDLITVVDVWFTNILHFRLITFSEIYPIM